MWCDAGHITVSAGTPFGVLPDARERQQCAFAMTQSFGKGRGSLAPANEGQRFIRVEPESAADRWRPGQTDIFQRI
jgi:hypothetical protein